MTNIEPRPVATAGKPARWHVALATAVLGIIVLILNIPTLLRGASPAGSCGVMVPFLPGLDRFQNCDTPLFNHLAQSLDAILDADGATRQGRPGYMALGWLVDRVTHVVTLGAYDPSATGSPQFTSAELGYLIINLVVLTAAVSLTLRMLQPLRRLWGVAALVGLLLAANPVTRAFFWTAHTQMFNLLVPPLSIWLTAAVLRRTVSWRWVVVVGLALGLALTAYGSFAVAIATVAAGLAVHRNWAKAAALVGLGLAPMALWWAFVTMVTGTFVSVETRDHRQFVWILDGLSDGGLPSRIFSNIGWFLTTFTDAQTVAAILIVTVVLGLILGWVIMGNPAADEALSSVDSAARRWLIPAAALLLPIQFVFLFLMGFYQTRLSWGLITTLVAALAAMAGYGLRASPLVTVRTINVTCAVLGLAWYAYWLAIPGPWH